MLLSINKVFGLVVVGCLLSGCSVTRQASLMKVGPAMAKRAPVAAVMKTLDSRRSKMRTMVARMNVVVSDLESGKEKVFTGAYLGDANGNFRLRVKLDTRVVLDVAFTRKNVDLWMPAKNRFYRGLRSEIKKSDCTELCLLDRAGNAQDLFFPICWAPGADERYIEKNDGIDFVVVSKRQGKLLTPLRRLTLNQDLPVCSVLELFSSASAESKPKLLGSIDYSEYRFPGPFAGKAADRPKATPYPVKVSLGFSETKKKISFEVVELIMNTPVPVTSFKIKAPEDTKIRKLAEALKVEGSIFSR